MASYDAASTIHQFLDLNAILPSCDVASTIHQSLEAGHRRGAAAVRRAGAAGLRGPRLCRSGARGHDLRCHSVVRPAGEALSQTELYGIK